MDRWKLTVLVSLDFSAAFDTVDHQILLHRLQTGETFDWFKSYLTGQRHCVTVYGTRSNQKPLKCGVPQGSVLSPVLFLVYVWRLSVTLLENMI